MARAFKLPDLGEGIHEGDILAVLVKVGDKIEEGHPILEVETDKATVEIPSPYTGTLESISVNPGDVVKVGDVLMTFSGGDEAEAPPERVEKPAEAEAPPERVEKPAEAEAPPERVEAPAEAEAPPERVEKPAEAEARGTRANAPGRTRPFSSATFRDGTCCTPPEGRSRSSFAVHQTVGP